MVRSEKARKTREDIPDVYKDMLADAAAVSSATNTDEEGRSVKRRRIGGRIVKKSSNGRDQDDSHEDGSHLPEDGLSDLFDEPQTSGQHLIKSESDDSADDMDWEEVDLQQTGTADEHATSEDEKHGELNLTLGATSAQSGAKRHIPKRKPVTAAERKLRLEIHKMHLCCLLAHVHLRNHWCDDADVHRALRRITTDKMISYLNPNEKKSQFQRSRSFMDGLEQASEAFRANFKVTARGLSRPVWASSPEALATLQPPTDIDLPMKRADFVDGATELRSSRDVGAQLFCALLRSMGVDVRLVCSLQTLPFHAVAANTTPQKPYAAFYATDGKTAIDASTAMSGAIVSDRPQSSDGGESSNLLSHKGVSTTSNSDNSLPILAKGHPRKPIRESKYPVYWVEAFNEPVQKWIPVDPLVTQSIGKPSKFEPPAGEGRNHLAYVVAFEEDGAARDVTRRYAKAYNAKTRRDRVESTKGGDKWWRMAMRRFRRHFALDRDELEDAELNGKEAQEPMPKNVQDFRSHPYYALERHLRRNEVIHPKREVGKVGTAKVANQTSLESIYRRRDVHIVQSGDKWYRMGREIKAGEQALKRVATRRTREHSTEPQDENGGEESPGTLLYAIYQTKPYIAKPIVDGRIPKNVYGNLDIYVPSMVPPGGTHVQHPEAARAAKVLGIDYADAVTGFTFKGRHGTAVTNGAVIAVEHKEAVSEVIATFEDERLQAEEERRSLEALRIWKRFLAGLRIRQRIDGYDIEGDRDFVEQSKDEDGEGEQESDDIGGGGGFFPGQDSGGVAEPTATYFPERLIGDAKDTEGGFLSESADEDDDSPERKSHSPEPVEDDSGGGFMIDENGDKDARQAEREISAAHTKAVSSSKILEPDEGRFPREEATAGIAHQQSSETGLADTYTAEPSGDMIADADIGSCLSVKELEEARALQRVYEDQRVEASRSNVRDQQVPQTTKIGSPSRKDAVLSERHTNFAEQLTAAHDSPQVPAMPQKDSTPSVAGTSEPSEDKGSLLSEDPDDEDAEPEWLA